MSLSPRIYTQAAKEFHVLSQEEDAREWDDQEEGLEMSDVLHDEEIVSDSGIENEDLDTQD